MSTKLTSRKLNTTAVADIHRAAVQARAEYVAEVIYHGWRGLQRAGRWLAGRVAPGVSRKHSQSFYRCPECPTH